MTTKPLTRIVATLGPASAHRDTIRALALSGVSVFRLNFSHGTHEQHAKVYETIRAVESELGTPVAVMADLQGPKLRLGTFEGSAATIRYGDAFMLDSDPTPGTAERVSVPHPEVLASLEPGHRLLIDDGRLRLEVVERRGEAVLTRIDVGGRISDRKGISLPDTVISTTSLTAKDRTDLAFALDLGADWIALSFVQRPEDIAEGRALIDGRAQVLAKIEKPSAIHQLDAIVEASDAVMVARGDLGVELPPEDVPPLQKLIVRTARRIGRPVIVATQMLESMTSAAVPTRAEAADVANAVYEGADGVMLSAETASGNHPVPAVLMMRRIIERVEQDPARRALEAANVEHASDEPVAQAIGRASVAIAETVGAKLIACFTTTGRTAVRVARARPEVPILSLAPSIGTARQTLMTYGVVAGLSHDVATFEDVVDQARRLALSSGLVGPGDRIVIAAGIPFGKKGSTNTVRVAEI
jgi:pyruvate kinase